MKLTSDNETLAEKKALILYILDKVSKPISNDALLKLVVSIDNMNYFYFQQFLLDLLENKYILKFDENGEEIYELTEEGTKALSLVKDIIPGITKLKVDNRFKNTIDEYKNEVSISSDFIPHNENEYSVKCKIVEEGQTLFDLEVYAGSRNQAKNISDNWNNNAENIYPKILEILAKKDIED